MRRKYCPSFPQKEGIKEGRGDVGGIDGDSVGFGVIFNREQGVPSFGGVFEKLYKVEIALSVEDMTTLKLFITAYAVTMLAKHYVCTVFYHSAALL